MDIGRTAAELYSCHTAERPTLLTKPFLNASIENAWAVQHAYTKLRLDNGDTLIGYKVGCTSAQTQAQLGIAHPIYGHLFASHRSFSPQCVALADFDGFAVEGELAVELNCDPNDLHPSDRNLSQAISRVFPVIELHHAGNAPDQSLTAPVLIGNNGIHAGFVQHDPQAVTIEQPVRNLQIYFDSKCVADLKKRELYETVFNSLKWLCESVRNHDHTYPMTPPVTVLCGTVAPLFRLDSPTRVEVATNAQQSICCNVS